MISEKGIKFYGNSGVKEISGSGGVADGVVIKDGTKLQADVIVLGTGRQSFLLERLDFSW